MPGTADGTDEGLTVTVLIAEIDSVTGALGSAIDVSTMTTSVVVLDIDVSTMTISGVAIEGIETLADSEMIDSEIRDLM